MPHRNAADRANWLRALAGTLPTLTDPEVATSALGVKQTAETLNEIADYLDTSEPGRLPPDTLWVTIHGPALYYFNNEDDTLTQARLDADTGFEVSGNRERMLIATLLDLAKANTIHAQTPAAG